MSHKITLSTRDNKHFEFFCEDNQTIQDAAEASHLYPPFGCKSGICGACLGHCQTGEYELGSYSDAALPDESVDKGDILLCCTKAKSDLQINLPYDSVSIQQTLLPPREAKITHIEEVAARTLKVVLQLKEDAELGLAFDFEPGQFVELEVVELDLMRAYSISNVSNYEGRLEFLIRLQPDGKFSAFLQQTAIGQTVLVHAPSGAFVLSQQSTNPRCFIAGGTGLAPFLSMLSQMVERGEDHPTHLLLGVNNEAEILCQQELAQLQQSLPSLTVEICVWKPEGDWQGFVGTPIDAFKTYLDKNNADIDVYLCGPPRLVEASIHMALDAGVKEAHIYSEKFVAS